MKAAVSNLNQFQGNDRAHLQHLADVGVEVIMIVEAIRANGEAIPVQQLLGKGWRTNQDTSSSDRAGSCIAWKTSRVRAFWGRLLLAFQPYLRSGRRVSMRARHVSVKALRERGRRTARRIRFAAAHYAPDWADADGSLRVQMEERLLDLVDAPGRAPIGIGADVNDPVHKAAAALGLEVVGAGVMAFMYDRSELHVTNFHTDPWGLRHDASDHADLIFDIERK